MSRKDIVPMLREAGFNHEADRIEAVTPEQEAAFEEWLDEDDNRERWDKAIADARARMTPDTPYRLAHEYRHARSALHPDKEGAQ